MLVTALFGFCFGLIASLGFVPFGIWPMTIAGLAAFMVFTIRCSGRMSALAGYSFGIGLFGVTVSYVSVMGIWIGVALVAVLSLYTAIYGIVQNKIQRFKIWPLLVPAAWVAMEFCWSRFPLGGFGWVRLAFTSPDQPIGGLLWLLAASGIGYLIAFCASCLAAMVSKLVLGKHRSVLWLIPVSAIFVAGVIGQTFIPSKDGEQQVSVGMVQGDVAGSAGPRALGYARSVTNNHFSETVLLLAKARSENIPIDFILWPENSSDHDPTVDVKTEQMVQKTIELGQSPLFMGAVMEGPGEDERQTTSLWYDADGAIIGRHDKRNAVPFGEYTPFKDLVFKLVPMAKMVGRQTVEGSQPGVLDVLINEKPLKVGTIICFELAFDDTIYDLAKKDAQLIVVQSNNSTYTGTFQPKQQFQITRVRAMELAQPIVVSTTSSFSGHIDEHGRVIDRTEEATSASRIYQVPIGTVKTPAVYVGKVVDYLCLTVTLLSIGATVVKRRPRHTKINFHD